MIKDWRIRDMVIERKIMGFGAKMRSQKHQRSECSQL